MTQKPFDLAFSVIGINLLVLALVGIIVTGILLENGATGMTVTTSIIGTVVFGAVGLKILGLFG